jgi:hypothetical protein
MIVSFAVGLKEAKAERQATMLAGLGGASGRPVQDQPQKARYMTSTERSTVRPAAAADER